jgi:ATP-dependent Clp protease ATP-binding subunit ClpA
VLERLTDHGRSAVSGAQDAARSLGHAFIGTEHLLLGLLSAEDCAAARVLRSFDVVDYRVRATVERIVGRGDGPPTAAVTFTPRARNALELALREARSMGSEVVGTEHILLGVLRENVGVARSILLEHGVTPAAARERIAEFAHVQGPEPATTAAAGRFSREHHALLEGLDRSLGVRALARHVGVPQRRVRELAEELRAMLGEL